MVFKTIDGLTKKIFWDFIYEIHKEKNGFTGQNKTWFFKTTGKNYFFMEI